MVFQFRFLFFSKYRSSFSFLWAFVSFPILSSSSSEDRGRSAWWNYLTFCSFDSMYEQINWCWSIRGDIKFIEWNPSLFPIDWRLSPKLLKYLFIIFFMYSELIVSFGWTSSFIASGFMYFLIPSMSWLASLISSMNWGLCHNSLPHFNEFWNKTHLWGFILNRPTIVAMLARFSWLRNDQVGVVEVSIVPVNLSWSVSRAIAQF